MVVKACQIKSSRVYTFILKTENNLIAPTDQLKESKTATACVCVCV